MILKTNVFQHELLLNLEKSFLCEVAKEQREYTLWDRESDIKLQPIWLDASEIIRINRNYDKTSALEKVLSETTEFIINEVEERN